MVSSIMMEQMVSAPLFVRNAKVTYTDPGRIYLQTTIARRIWPGIRVSESPACRRARGPLYVVLAHIAAAILLLERYQ